MENVSSLFGPETFGPEACAGPCLSREEGVSFHQLDRHLERAYTIFIKRGDRHDQMTNVYEGIQD